MRGSLNEMSYERNVVCLTRLSVPVQASLVIELFPEILSMKTEWDREDLSLQLVAATIRFFWARLRRLMIADPLVTSSIWKYYLTIMNDYIISM